VTLEQTLNVQRMKRMLLTVFIFFASFFASFFDRHFREAETAGADRAGQNQPDQPRDEERLGDHQETP
jgi:hypothetical protein